MSIGELIKAASDRMRADFEMSRKKFGSPVDIGADRVNILKDFLTKYLPRHYGFGNGEIIDSYGNRSGQVDIIICNQSHPYTYNDEGFGLFLAEGVDWAIEVKSNLANELEQGMSQVKRIKGLMKEKLAGLVYGSDYVMKRNKICCMLFGYNSPSIATLRDGIKRLASQLRLSEEEMPDAVVALNKGIVFNVSEGDSLHAEVDGVRKYGIIGEELKKDTLVRMLIFLSEYAPHILHQSPIISKYTTFPKAPMYFDEQ